MAQPAVSMPRLGGDSQLCLHHLPGGSNFQRQGSKEPVLSCSSAAQMHLARCSRSHLSARIAPLPLEGLEIGGTSKRMSRSRRKIVVGGVWTCSSLVALDSSEAATTSLTGNDFLVGNKRSVGDESDTSAVLGGSLCCDTAALSTERCICDVENLVQGHVGKFAFLGMLLFGVGVSCLTNVGPATATTSHINTGGLDIDMRALALGPEGPFVEEFWDNMRRYGLYFLTVVTGGIYSLVRPIIDALRSPLSAVLIIMVITGSIFLVALTVSAMLGINEFQYDYAL